MDFSKIWNKLWPYLVFISFWGGILIIPVIWGNATSDTSSSQSSDVHTTSDSRYEDSTSRDTYIRGDYSDNHGTYDCTSDCSGHQAGYEWGEEHDICDTSYDNTNSDSFNEGVQAWAEDNCDSDLYYDY